MAKYTISYEMRKETKHASYSKTIDCDSEYSAIEIAKGQGQKDKPGYEFILKKVDKR